MKKYFLLALLMISVFGVRAQGLLHDPFNYTPDPVLGLAAQSSSNWLIVNTGDSILVDAGNLSYTGLAASTGNKIKFDNAGTDYYRIFASQTTGTIYSSFILNVSSLGTMTTAGGYFAGFIQAGSTSLFGAAVWTRLSTTAGKYNVGISTRSNSAVSWLAAELDPGTPQFIVFAYVMNAAAADDVTKIWLNTTAIGAAEPAADATSVPGTDLTSVERFFLRQASTTGTPFIEMDEVRVGTTWASVTPSSVATPALTIATVLPIFGDVCINTTAGPNSFTINGSNLTTADVTVGALAGYTYSTTAGGTYTPSLTITQAGGGFTQDVFVRFSPTAVQSYAGNIPVAGGGVSVAVNAAASGTGINTAATVTSGAASAITQTGATVAGTVTDNGCAALTAYGIEYSTTAGFPNGTGTPVASTNIAAGIYSSALTGLTAATVYYYHAYATTAAGTSYGTEQTFTTAAAVPALSAGALTAFGNVCINTSAGPNSFTITGTNLTAADVTVAALTGYTYSTTAGGTYTTTLTLTQPGGAFSQAVFVKFDPVAVQSYNGNIAISGGGATAIDVAASGAGVNTVATVISGAASAITLNTATVAGSITANGCSAVTAYGIEYSTTAGFPNGTGTAVSSTNIAAGNFSSDLTGLGTGITYYYHAYATNGGGTAYGAELSFTTASPNPVITVTPLTAFGNICINSIEGPNSFTISGTNLTAADITVAALPGFTYSTTAAGSYTSTLTLTQPGGTFTQDIFVIFSPLAVQSYSGNIVVNGAGIAAPVNVPASGAGINTLATVTSGSATAVTATSATVAGNISNNGCTAVTAYGIEYSTTAGFPNGTGTPVASANIVTGGYTSVLSGLTSGTTYYYHAYATNGGGTAYGAELSFTTLTPTISATALTAFGNVCTNTTTSANAFTITGANLSAADVTVGPLAGFTFSTTSGGTYTASLSLVQPGGAFTQDVFVKFTPAAVQSYSGNIPVNGGGITTAVNVAASGAGVNSPATVTTGAASAITYNSATAAGTITATGCTAVTAYGIEYSTTNGFANGTGTSVASTNLSAGAFSSALTGLAASTVYYYKAWATNGGGTAYGAQQTFTTAAVPISITATTLTAFGSACINTTLGPNSFTINGSFLTTANINVGPLAGYSFSTTSGGTYTPSLSLTQAGGTYSQVVYVKFTPTAVQSYNGNIPVAGGGFATTVNVAASGTGLNTPATVTTGSPSRLTTQSVILAGELVSVGCSPVTSYGIEWSTIQGFANGTGTPVAGAIVTGGSFEVPLTGLVQGATYYYKAYATNNGGTAYGAQQTFTVLPIGNGFNLYPNPAARGTEVRITAKDVKPGYYGLLLLNAKGERVYQWHMNIQSTFINQAIPVPASLPTGVYRAYLVGQDKEVGVITLLVL